MISCSIFSKKNSGDSTFITGVVEPMMLVGIKIAL